MSAERFIIRSLTDPRLPYFRDKRYVGGLRDRSDTDAYLRLFVRVSAIWKGEFSLHFEGYGFRDRSNGRQADSG